MKCYLASVILSSFIRENTAPFHQIDINMVRFVKWTISRYGRDTGTYI